jgi:RNA polymerase sigma-70 factor, ECF subfamily
MGEAQSEETLMAAYASGDRDAFEQLFALLAPSIHGFFLRSFRDRSLADELMQETFLKIHRGRASYLTSLPVRPWVFTIASHVRRDELRRRYRIKEACDEDALLRAEEQQALESVAQQQLEAGDRERRERVRDAVDRLPESQRVVLHLHRFEGMTFGQVATILGTSEVAVRGRAFRAYEQLRKELVSPNHVDSTRLEAAVETS